MQRGTPPPALPQRETHQRPTQPGLRTARTSQPISQPVLRDSGVAASPSSQPPALPSRRVPSRSTVQPTAAAMRAQASAAADAEVERMGEQIVELIERLRASDDRAAYAEQMLEQANAALSDAQANAQFVTPDLDVPVAQSGIGSYVPWIALALVSALSAAGYVLSYAPLHERYDAQLKMGQEQTAQQTQALASLRSSFSTERQKLEAELAEAKSAAQAAVVAAAPSGDTTSALDASPAHAKSKSGSSSHAADSSSDHSEHAAAAAEARAAKAEQRKAEREARHEAYLAKKAERQAKHDEAVAARKSSKSDSDDASSSSSHAKAETSAKSSKPASEELGPSSGGNDPLEGL